MRVIAGGAGTVSSKAARGIECASPADSEVKPTPSSMRLASAKTEICASEYIKVPGENAVTLAYDTYI